ncbi:hypothetical protein HDU93_003802, partial [Gonapodya sp. JEL0774]
MSRYLKASALLSLRLASRSARGITDSSVQDLVLYAAQTHMNTSYCKLVPLLLSRDGPLFMESCWSFAVRCRSVSVDLLGYADLLFKPRKGGPRLSLSETALFMVECGIAGPELHDLWGTIGYGENSSVRASSLFQELNRLMESGAGRRIQPYPLLKSSKTLALERYGEDSIPLMISSVDAWMTFEEDFVRKNDAVALAFTVHVVVGGQIRERLQLCGIEVVESLVDEWDLTGTRRLDSW